MKERAHPGWRSQSWLVQTKMHSLVTLATIVVTILSDHSQVTPSHCLVFRPERRGPHKKQKAFLDQPRNNFFLHSRPVYVRVTFLFFNYHFLLRTYGTQGSLRIPHCYNYNHTQRSKARLTTQCRGGKGNQSLSLSQSSTPHASTR